MRQIEKNVFIALQYREIEMYQAFQKVLDIVLSEAKGKDGKMINKRFIDRINELIGKDDSLKYDNGICKLINSVRFSFSTDYSGDRNGRFIMYYGNRYVREAGSHIDWDRLEIRGIYLKDGKYMDYKAFSESIANEKNYCINKINSKTDAINGADNYIKVVKQIKTYVESALKGLPSDLFTNFTLEPAIY